MWRNTTGLAIKTKRRQLVNKMWNHCRTITDVDDWLLTFKFPGMAGYSVSVCAHREHRCVDIISYYSNSRVYFMNKLMKFLKILPSRYYRRTTVKSSVQLPHHNLCNSASIILYELYRMTNQHKMPPLICTTCALFYTNWQTLCLIHGKNWRHRSRLSMIQNRSMAQMYSKWQMTTAPYSLAATDINYSRNNLVSDISVVARVLSYQVPV